MCFDRKAWHETSAAWSCMCRRLWDRQAGTFGRSTRSDTEDYSWRASLPAFKHLLLPKKNPTSKDYQNAGNHLPSKILLSLTLHNHASCLPNHSKWPGTPLVPEVCSPCLNFPAMHFRWIQDTSLFQILITGLFWCGQCTIALCFMTVANIILSAVIILDGIGIHGSSISGLSVAYLHSLVKCLMLDLSTGSSKILLDPKIRMSQSSRFGASLLHPSKKYWKSGLAMILKLFGFTPRSKSTGKHIQKAWRVH